VHPRPDPTAAERTSLRVVSLFSGAGGLDLGLERAGHRIVQLCENWPPAQRVLSSHFENVPIAEDVRTLHIDQPYDLLAAGFPCVDLSHAGRQQGIFGPQSGLVGEVFRIASENRPRFVLIENVTNLLRLGRGVGIAHIIDSLTALGYSWSYRVLDSRFTGVPQRRRRVFLLAALDTSPRHVLLGEDSEEPVEAPMSSVSSGFYWTEGRRGVGLVQNAIPTLKGGSTLGLPSAPAVWDPAADIGRRIVVPTIEHAEALQGFPEGWTAAASVEGEPDRRWKLTGNAVTVGVADWLGERLATDVQPVAANEAQIDRAPLIRTLPWPDAAFGDETGEWRSPASNYPVRNELRGLASVLADGAARPLSRRATSGFLSRVRESGIKLPPAFTDDLDQHVIYMEGVESWASSSSSRARMQRVPRSDSVPEKRIRTALTARGARYRLQVKLLEGERFRSDIVFLGARVVVDVRGCYWHACPEHGTAPKQNAARWATKFEENRDRDARMVAALTQHGWHVETVWEHEGPEDAADRIMSAVRTRRELFGKPESA
jgi:DNA (cytosine-5)-methyltransferase 1